MAIVTPRPIILASAAALACAGLTACERRAEPDPAEQPAPPPTPSPAIAEPADANRDLAPPTLTPEAERGETGARNVLLEWARALERGDYARAYAQWGEAGAASGISRDDHAKQWSQFRSLTVSVPEGVMEGAAGSSYYTVPVTIDAVRQDGDTTRLTGQVVLRRVNDVPGATAEQLRWHIMSSELKPR